MNRLLELGIDEIHFSLDTLDEGGYNSIRGVVSLDKVRENIEEFSKLKGEKQSETRMLITIVVSDETLKELPNMIRYTYSIGLDDVIATWAPAKATSNQQRNYIIGKTKEIHGEKIKEVREKSTELAKKLDIKLIIYDSRKEYALNCKFIRRYTYITWNGFITPCCQYRRHQSF